MSEAHSNQTMKCRIHDMILFSHWYSKKAVFHPGYWDILAFTHPFSQAYVILYFNDSRCALHKNAKKIECCCFHTYKIIVFNLRNSFEQLNSLIKLEEIFEGNFWGSFSREEIFFVWLVFPVFFLKWSFLKDKLIEIGIFPRTFTGSYNKNS